MLVGVSAARQAALQSAGQPIPLQVPARMLVDTGASHTCLDPSIIAPLGISPTGVIAMHTPSTQGQAQQVFQYDVSITIPHPLAMWGFQALPVSVCSLASQNIFGLIGRDVLDHVLLVYNGVTKSFTLAL
ncbi:MAG: aspartyl protease family protein [Vulcanimicrobiaceae bacterium]